MNEHDSQLDAALTDTFARRDREVGHVAGDVTDVYRRVARRKTKRRTLTAVTSVALVAGGIGGLVAIGQVGSDAPARSAGGPVATMPDEGGSWYVCSGAMVGDDGSTVYDWCELETPYANPAWSCIGQIADPATDGDDRPRFQSCTAVGEAYPATGTGACVAAVAPATTVPGAPAEAVAPPSTWLAPSCQPQVAPTTAPAQCVPPTVVPTTMPAPTLPPMPATTPVEYLCPMPIDPPPSVPASTTPMLPTTTRPGPAPTAPPLPTQSPRVFAIGDSVMLGASDVLTPRGWTVFAVQTMQMVDAVPIVEELAATGFFADTETVVIHVGTNGNFSAATLDAVLAPLAEVPNVLLYTVHADRTWTAPNNELLRTADQPGDNIALIDWDARVQDCRDDCLAADGIHLAENGKEFYADLARDWTGM